jgi:hypothetical protein
MPLAIHYRQTRKIEGVHPKKVVGILAYKPLPHKSFVASYIGFELVLGIEWALTALFL